MQQSYKKIVEDVRPEIEKAYKFFESEVQKSRTSHASPSLVEDIVVNCFGSDFPMKQLGAISCPQANQIVIQPWDKSYLEPIEKAIAKSGLGMSVAVDKDVIRLNLPLLTEEYREAMLRALSEKAEQARKTIRHWREVAWENLQEGFKAKTVTEDEKFRGKDDLQKIVDKYTEEIKNLIEKQKNDII